MSICEKPPVLFIYINTAVLYLINFFYQLIALTMVNDQQDGLYSLGF